MSDSEEKTSKDSEFKPPPPPAKKYPNPRLPSSATPATTRSRSATPRGTATGAATGTVPKSTSRTQRTSSASSAGSRGSTSSRSGISRPSAGAKQTTTEATTTKAPSRTPSPSRLTPPPASSTIAEGGAAAAAAEAFGDIDESTILNPDSTVIEAAALSEDNQELATDSGRQEEAEEGQPDRPDPVQSDPEDNSPPPSSTSENDQGDLLDEEAIMDNQKAVTIRGQQDPVNVNILDGKGDLWDRLMVQRSAGDFITSGSAQEISRVYALIPNVPRNDAHKIATILSSFNVQYNNIRKVDAGLKELLADEQSYRTFRKFSTDKLMDMEDTIDKGQRILQSSEIKDTGDPSLDETLKVISPKVTIDDTSGAVNMASTTRSSARSRRDSDGEGRSYDQPKKYELERLKWNGSKQTYSNFKKLATQVLGPVHYTYLTRFSCLKEVLPDSQIKVMESYAHDARGYQAFWDYLDRTFEQKTENVNYWLNKLNHLKGVEENNGRISLSQLENFFTSLKLIISKLEENGKYGKDNHEEWKTTIGAKLPQSISMAWQKKYKKLVNEADPLVDPIQKQLEFLEEEVDYLRVVVTDFNMRKSYNTDQSKKAKDKEKAKQEQTYATVTTEGGKGKKKKKKGAKKGNEEYKSTAPASCMLCDDPNKKHHPKDCKKPAKDAWSRLYTHKACGGCGNIGHGIYSCQSKTKCTKDGCTWHHMVNLHDIPFVKKKEWTAKQKQK